MRNEACFVWIGQALADGSCLRTSSGSGSATDTQLANTITDALFSMPAVGGSAGSVDVDEKATWETCIDCFLKWVEVERIFGIQSRGDDELPGQLHSNSCRAFERNNTVTSSSLTNGIEVDAPRLKVPPPKRPARNGH